MSRLVRMPEEWRARDFHHIYSWSASLIVSLLLWRELKPLSLAVGLAVFGLNSVRIRLAPQDRAISLSVLNTIAFTAAFARIFFANLAAGEPGVFLSDRMITVAPLVLIFFFVYAQLPASEETTSSDRRFHFDSFRRLSRNRHSCRAFLFPVPGPMGRYGLRCSCVRSVRGRVGATPSHFLASGNSSHSGNLCPRHGPQSFRWQLFDRRQLERPLLQPSWARPRRFCSRTATLRLKFADDTPRLPTPIAGRKSPLRLLPGLSNSSFLFL